MSVAFVRFLIDSVEISTTAAISLVAYWCKDCFFYHPRHSVVWCVYLNYEGISETQWASRTAYCCPCWILRRVIIYMAQNKRTKQGLEKKTTMVRRAEVSINDLRVFKPQTAWAKLYLEYIFSLCSLFITSFGFLSFFTLGTCCLCWQHSNKG